MNINLHKIFANYYPLRRLLLSAQNEMRFNRLQSNISLNNNVNNHLNNKLLNEESIDDKLYKTIEIECRSADSAVLKSYEMFVSMSARHLGITISRTWEPFRKITRRTLLRSAFVKKKYRVQYEFRTYFRNIEFKHITGSTADTFLEYIERNVPEGVALKVYKTAIETLPKHIIQPNSQTLSQHQNES